MSYVRLEVFEVRVRIGVVGRRILIAGFAHFEAEAFIRELRR